ncbi:DNA recombination protein RmuC [Marisediminicola senii]|uniref:DNA recombination protein RmuC n=1 Tax=Marisediminicola senii TaxID=2711233 RepID=UPI0013ED4689|nr:DNA recombination protein RmuC [Marisediminicola senii]
MTDVLPLILVLIVGILLGAGLGWFAAQQRLRTADPRLSESRHALELAEARVDAAAEHSRMAAAAASAEATATALRDQLRAQREQYLELVARQTADRDAAAERGTTESAVLQALTPVQETLRTMQRTVSELEHQRQLQHGELGEQLRSAAASEERLRVTADSLAAALRNNATRGVWGETQLRNVVESAGMLERVDFDVQNSITSDAGAGRPDMVVRLPGGKSIPVDAKVPFSAFIDASAIPDSASPGELARRDRLMTQHVAAVRDHVSTLGSKAYWQGLSSSPELVIAFIPSESLVSSALAADPSIMEFAFSKRVAIASPVTLWSVLKTVAFSWQQDVVTQEAKQLFDLSRELYGRISTVATHVEKLGRSIEGTVKNYNSFVGSLERQVLPSARKLNLLDESRVIATLPGIDESPRQLTAPELTAALDADERRAPLHPARLHAVGEAHPDPTATSKG